MSTNTERITNLESEVELLKQKLNDSISFINTLRVMYEMKHPVEEEPKSTAVSLASTIVDRAAIVSNRTIDSVIIPNSKTIKQDILVDSTDITNGYFLRYFLQDKITRNIIEVKNKKYIEMLKESYTVGITLKWIIKAPAENIKRNGYTYIGASQKNKEAVEAAEKTVIGIKNFIKSYDQFVN